jgi:hypothetical protein
LGYVTNSLAQARQVFAQTMNVTCFRQRERRPATRLRGAAGEASLLVAVANVAGAQIEIIEPIAGQIDVFRDALARDGFVLSFHHIAYRFEGGLKDWRRHLAALQASGRPIAWQSAPSEEGEFAYTDDRSRLGHYVEHLWSTDARWRQALEGIPYN